jgi:hypothetical protein
MRIQSSHDHAARDLDAYFSPPEAVMSLLGIEGDHLPNCIWEPAAGDGAIVRPFKDAGFKVVASDIADYGLEDCKSGVDYLKAQAIAGVGGIITNPPYKLAVDFAEKALREVPYLALLLRTNFLESMARLAFFRQHQPARIWISSRRLPMMHRHGWSGPRAPSNTCFAWFVWDARSAQKRIVDWFDWKQFPVKPGRSDVEQQPGSLFRAAA